MTDIRSTELQRLPSLRGLYVFDAASRHLNLVRAAEELGVTQSALSRQIRQLEDYLGVALFERLPRGLALTEAGDILKYHCRLGFKEMDQGISTITRTHTRQGLRIAAARSYATRVICPQVAAFSNLNPWIDLIIDGHRHMLELGQKEADAAIRVGDGRWTDAICEKIEDDPLFPVASPSLIARIGTTNLSKLSKKSPILHFFERPYWSLWKNETGINIESDRQNLRFSETVMMIEAAEAGQGIALARRSLVRQALADNRLVRLSEAEVDDGIGYYFCATPESLRRKKVSKFREWVFSLNSDAKNVPLT